jgi:hypothetical protein
MDSTGLIHYAKCYTSIKYTSFIIWQNEYKNNLEPADPKLLYVNTYEDDSLVILISNNIIMVMLLFLNINIILKDAFM